MAIIKNQEILNHQFLNDMYEDDYFPEFMVDKIKDILINVCIEIESKSPNSDESLFLITHAAVEKINDLQEEFAENDSEIETAAREAIGADFEFIVRVYDFNNVDIEDVIAPRDW
jgi:uncharacterized protein YydD (DUF2326 family)